MAPNERTRLRIDVQRTYESVAAAKVELDKVRSDSHAAAEEIGPLTASIERLKSEIESVDFEAMFAQAEEEQVGLNEVEDKLCRRTAAVKTRRSTADNVKQRSLDANTVLIGKTAAVEHCALAVEAAAACLRDKEDAARSFLSSHEADITLSQNNIHSQNLLLQERECKAHGLEDLTNARSRHIDALAMQLRHRESRVQEQTSSNQQCSTVQQQQQQLALELQAKLQARESKAQSDSAKYITSSRSTAKRLEETLEACAAHAKEANLADATLEQLRLDAEKADAVWKQQLQELDDTEKELEEQHMDQLAKLSEKLVEEASVIRTFVVEYTKMATATVDAQTAHASSIMSRHEQWYDSHLDVEQLSATCRARELEVAKVAKQLTAKKADLVRRAAEVQDKYSTIAKLAERDTEPEVAPNASEEIVAQVDAALAFKVKRPSTSADLRLSVSPRPKRQKVTA